MCVCRLRSVYAPMIFLMYVKSQFGSTFSNKNHIRLMIVYFLSVNIRLHKKNPFKNRIVQYRL